MKMVEISNEGLRHAFRTDNGAVTQAQPMRCGDEQHVFQSGVKADVSYFE